MGSGCTKAAEVASLDSQGQEDDSDQKPIDEEGIQTESGSLHSGSSGPSRPPTPFSRPVTGAVLARPKTTTIFEKQILREDAFDLGQEDAPELGCDELALSDDKVVGPTPPLPQNGILKPPQTKRCANRTRHSEDMEIHPVHRPLSNILPESSEEIARLKAHLAQNGL